MFTPLGAAATDNGATAGGAHAFTETVSPRSLDLAGLVSSFHGNSPWKRRSVTYTFSASESQAQTEHDTETCEDLAEWLERFIPSREELQQRYLLQPKQSDFIDFLLADISEKMHTDQQDYFYKGYYYTILSKIVPYNQMLVCLYDGINEDLYLNAKKVLNAWKSLYRFMLFSMQKNTQDLQTLINKIHSISKLYFGVK